MPPVTMPVQERQELQSTEAVHTVVCPWWMPQSVVSLFPVRLFIFSWLFNFQAVFNVIYVRGYLTSSGFAIKRALTPISTHIIPIHHSFHHLVRFRFYFRVREHKWKKKIREEAGSGLQSKDSSMHFG